MVRLRIRKCLHSERRRPIHMRMTELQNTDALRLLGWSDFYADQLDAEDQALMPMRVARVHRARMSAQSASGTLRLDLPKGMTTADFAVGDWVLVDGAQLVVRRLDRQALLQRKTEGGRGPQLIAANVDTLFIVTSCNDDFNPARLERYLALANEAETTPVIVLTKADQADDIAPFYDAAAALQRGLEVVAVNSKTPEAIEVLKPWCGVGQTVALVGSSGVGKSTLLNTLAQKTGEDAQLTGGIREVDAKGRHTTTSRSLHAIAGGGWVIDTPGIRTLHLADLETGLAVLFAEITERVDDCRFRDCTHAHEPGCAILAAVERGEIDPARLERWRKLSEENAAATPDRNTPRGKRR